MFLTLVVVPVIYKIVDSLLVRTGLANEEKKQKYQELKLNELVEA